jgi:hypothetical protein
MEKFRLVEKSNHNRLHGLFYSKETAEKFLRETVPEYIKRGYYTDKTLTVDDFEVIEVNVTRSKETRKRKCRNY